MTIFVIAGTASVSALEVDSLSINISENPTKNTNIFGTTFNVDGFVTDWGTDYMMIRLKLTSDPKFTFLNLYLDAFANRGNQNTDPTNALRFALFAQDPVLNNLNDSDALAKTAINQALISPTFTDYLMGPGPGTINISPPDPDPAVNSYFLMIYAAGEVANQGYGLKVDKAAPVITFYAPDVPDPGLQVEYWNGTSFSAAVSQAPGGIPVPEPSTYIFGTLGSLVLASLSKSRNRISRLS
ncbi:hypothetical protein GC170_04835 [bacterium]|nr:hypothetical protein [bacterium]